MNPNGPPPYNLEAEQAVLGAILLDNSALGRVTSILRRQDFWREAHRWIFTAMLDLFERKEPIDLLTLADRLRSDGKLEEAGGEAYIAALIDVVPTAASAANHARLLKAEARRRELWAIGEEIKADINAGEELDEIASHAMACLEEVLEEADGHDSPLLIRACDLKAEPVTFLVEGLIPKGMLTLLSGKDKRGKTLLGLEITRAVLTGDDFLGQFPVEKGPVVGAFLDDPSSLTQERLESLGILSHPDLWVLQPDRVDFGQIGAFMEDLGRAAKERRAVLIVLDAFYLFLPQGRESENDAAAMRPLMGAFNRLVETTGAGVLLVAHDRKSGGDVAGSHVIRASAKAILRLTLPKETGSDDDDEPDTGRRTLRVESKFGPRKAWELEIWEADRGRTQWRLLGTSHEVRKADLFQCLRDYLHGGGRETAEKIAEGIGRRADDVRKALNHLVEAGEAEIALEGGRGRKAKIYQAISVPPQGGDLGRKLSPSESPSLLNSQEAIPVDRLGAGPDGNEFALMAVNKGKDPVDSISVPPSGPPGEKPGRKFEEIEL